MSRIHSVLMTLISLAGIALVGLAYWVSYCETPVLPAVLEVGGNLHPLVLHMPIGLFAYALFKAFVMPLVRRGGQPSSHHDMHPILALVALSAYLAAAFGILLYMQGGYKGDLVEDHMRWGVGFALVTLVQYGVVLCKPANMKMHRVLLILGALAMVQAGHYGGVMTHGDPFDPLRKEKPADAQDKTPSFETLYVYEDVVAKIFAEKCYRCHAEDTKQKGELLLDAYENIMAGGESGKVIVPGSLEDSLLSKLIHLPDDDEDRMPPEGKPQLVDEQIRIIDLWILGGALQKQALTDAGGEDELVAWAREFVRTPSATPAEEQEVTKPSAVETSP